MESPTKYARPRFKEVPCLFIDADGTIRLGPDQLDGRFIESIADVKLFPGVIDTLFAYKQLGYRIFLVSNQGGIEYYKQKAKGIIEALDYTKSLLCKDDTPLIDKLFYCPHYLIEGKPHCYCRKPQIGMLVGASAYLRRNHSELISFTASIVVGDRDEDRQLAENAQHRFIGAEEWRTTEPIVPQL